MEHDFHTHKCTECYERSNCQMDCSVDFDDETSPGRGGHIVCRKCNETASAHQQQLITPNVVEMAQRVERWLCDEAAAQMTQDAWMKQNEIYELCTAVLQLHARTLRFARDVTPPGEELNSQHEGARTRCPSCRERAPVLRVVASYPRHQEYQCSRGHLWRHIVFTPEKP